MSLPAAAVGVDGDGEAAADRVDEEQAVGPLAAVEEDALDAGVAGDDVQHVHLVHARRDLRDGGRLAGVAGPAAAEAGERAAVDDQRPRLHVLALVGQVAGGLDERGRDELGAQARVADLEKGRVEQVGAAAEEEDLPVDAEDDADAGLDVEEALDAVVGDDADDLVDVKFAVVVGVAEVEVDLAAEGALDARGQAGAADAGTERRLEAQAELGDVLLRGEAGVAEEEAVDEVAGLEAAGVVADAEVHEGVEAEAQVEDDRRDGPDVERRVPQSKPSSRRGMSQVMMLTVSPRRKRKMLAGSSRSNLMPSPSSSVPPSPVGWALRVENKPSTAALPASSTCWAASKKFVRPLVSRSSAAMPATPLRRGSMPSLS